MTADAPLRVAFVHAAMGIGGAERLMVNAALALQARGHRVSLHAAEHDPRRCLAATRDGRLDVRVHATALPPDVGGRLRLPLSAARAAAIGRAVARSGERFDAVVSDVVAQAVPALRWWTGVPVIFYGHYPDSLLTPPRRGWYRAYRWPLDRWEAAGLEAADRVLVNSAFTAAAFRRCYPRLRPTLEVLYPPVEPGGDAPPPSAGWTLAVISRLVGIKRLDLAVETLAALRARVAAATFARLRLVIAGGFDARDPDCTDTVARLAARAAALGVADQVEIARSPDDAQLHALLASARALLYTPVDEHFGLVPVEAMAAGRPVIAADSGGPTETVVEGVTGFLRPPTAAAFADALRLLVEDPALADRFGAAGRVRAARFSLDAFGERLEATIRAACGSVSPAARA